jgi:apolipoprotein N-acyltransferase
VRPAVAALAGAGLVLAFPPYGVWPLAVPAVAALTWCCREQRLVTAAALGGLFGAVFFLGLMPWMRVIGPDAWIGLSALCALWLAALGVGLAVVSRLPGWPVFSAALWVAEEALRDRVPLGGYPWGRLAFGQVGTGFTGWAAVGGAPLVTFAVALSGSLLCYAFVQRGRRVVAVGALAGSVAVAAAGWLVPVGGGGPTVTVALVQGNVPRTGLDAFGQRQAVLDAHVAATRQLADDVAADRVPRPDFVVWPENSSDIDPARDPAAFAAIDGAVKAVGVPTLVGLVVATPDGTQLRNEGVVWDPVTGPGQTYVKRHPVPFGEFVPFRSTLERFVSRLDRVPRDFVGGDEPGVLDLAGTPVADVICFEVAYDEIVRDAVRGGGQLITVQTNNATYGRTGQVEQQLAISQLRAVEHGRAVVVAATSGISAVIAPDGTVVDRAPEFVRAVLVDAVPVRTALTLATRAGAWPELALTIVGIGALAAGIRRRATTGKGQA